MIEQDPKKVRGAPEEPEEPEEHLRPRWSPCYPVGMDRDLDRAARSLAQRSANERARGAGEPLPFPNPWDELDPTKLPPHADPEQIHLRVVRLGEICRRPPCKRHTL